MLHRPVPSLRVRSFDLVILVPGCTIIVRIVRTFKLVRLVMGWVFRVLILAGDGDRILTIHSSGLPGYAYQLQRATNLTTSNTFWLDLGTVVAGTNENNRGELIFQDTNPPTPASFYRTKQPPAPQ